MYSSKTHAPYSTPIDYDFDKIKYPVKSPIGYYGAKNRIAYRILDHIPPHSAWVEAFCGSAAVTFAKKPAPIEIINDVDDQITNLFEQLRSNSKELCEQIRLTPYARAEYEKSRAIDANLSPLEKARLFLVSTMMTVNGTKPGGFSVSHSYSRNNKEARVSRWYNLPHRIELVVERLRCIRIEKRDARDLLEVFQNRPATLVYLDPPYYVKRDFNYTNDADKEFHEDLLRICIRAKCMIMLSGYENDLYDSILTKKNGWTKTKIKAYTKGTNGKTFTRTEVLWKNEICERALKSNKIPIRLSAREKEIKKINPPRKYYMPNKPRF